MSDQLDRAATWYAALLLGVLPLVIVPGIDEYTLLPRLAILQALSFIFSIYLASEVLRNHRPFSLGFLELSLFWVILAASALWAANPFRSTFDLAKHAATFSAFLLLINTLPRHAIPRVLSVHAITGIAVSVIGIAEYFDISPITIPSTGRPSSTFGFRNLAGAYLAAGIPISFLLGLIGRSAAERWLGAAATSAMFIFLAYTRARASWFGLLAGVGAASLLYWLGRRPALPNFRSIVSHWKAILLFCITLTTALLPDNLAERHVQRFDEKKADLATTIGATFKPGGDRGRFEIWSATLEQILDYPVLGVGLGNWEYFYPLYDGGSQVSPGHSPHRPHNDILWIWSETGTIGLVAFLALLAGIGRRAWRGCRSETDGESAKIAVCGIASIVAVLGVGMFSFPWERLPPELLFWTGAALIWIASGGSTLQKRRTARWATVLLSLVLMTGLGITIRHIQFDASYIKAHVAFLKKDYPATGQFAAKALSNGPFEHQAFIMLGESFYQDQRWDQAEETYRSLLDYHPYFANAYNGLGLVAFGRKNHTEALERFDHARRIIPDHYIATYNKGLVYEDLGMIDSAMAAYRRSFHYDHTKPFVNLGAIYRKMGMVDSAVALYTRAARHYIPSTEAWFNLANLYADQKEFIASAEAFAQFLNRWTKDDSVRAAAVQGLSQAYSGFGVQAEQRGSVDSARASYEKAIEIAPSESINWFNLGNILRQLGELEEARNAYVHAIELSPEHLGSHSNLGMTYMDLGQTQDAIKIYRKARNLDPESAILNYNLGHALLITGAVQEAEHALDTFRKTWKDDPRLIHYYMGNVYAQSERFDEARLSYKTFLASWDHDDDIRKSAKRILESISPDPEP
jgi:tetratricopeptide (TPR) repeat protein/O-antigen ligase